MTCEKSEQENLRIILICTPAQNAVYSSLNYQIHLCAELGERTDRDIGRTGRTQPTSRGSDKNKRELILFSVRSWKGLLLTLTCLRGSVYSNYSLLFMLKIHWTGQRDQLHRRKKNYQGERCPGSIIQNVLLLNWDIIWWFETVTTSLKLQNSIFFSTLIG